MKLSRTVAYALQATMQLAQSGSKVPVPCSQIATRGNMPERFLLQVLRSLVTHGVLQSTRGVDGGYMLVRPADEITLLDVIEAIDGPINAHLPLQTTFEPQFQENLKQAMDLVNDTTRRQLATISISSLIQPAGEGIQETVAVIEPVPLDAGDLGLESSHSASSISESTAADSAMAEDDHAPLANLAASPHAG